MRVTAAAAHHLSHRLRALASTASRPCPLPHRVTPAPPLVRAMASSGAAPGGSGMGDHKTNPAEIPREKFGSGQPYTQAAQDDQAVVTGCDEMKEGEQPPAAMQELVSEVVQQDREAKQHTHQQQSNTPSSSSGASGGSEAGGGDRGSELGESEAGPTALPGGGQQVGEQGRGPEVKSAPPAAGGNRGGCPPDGAAAATGGYGATD